MSTHAVRSTGDGGHEAAAHELESSGISLAHIVRTLTHYRRAIFFWLASLAFLYVIAAMTLIVLSPGIEITSLPFRLDFEGAEDGLYPNGLKFSSTDILASNVLTRVYEATNAHAYLPFRSFKQAVFLQESSREVEKLQLEYETRLADARLTPVDRERIEREYQLRRSSLRHAEFSLNYADDGRAGQAVPRAERERMLRAILNVWAELADREKGAVKYRLPVLTTNVVGRNAVGPREYLIELDILRARINGILTNIDELQRIPGSEIVRVGPEKISLAEIRLNLFDIRRFQIDPLISQTYQKRLIRDPLTVGGYYQSQLSSAQRDYDQAKAHVAALQSSLMTYMGEEQGTARALAGQASAGAQSPSGQSVTPQLTEGFLDRIVKMATDSGDVKYRQDIVTEMNRVAIGDLLPAEKEVQYYQSVAQQMNAFAGMAHGDLSARAGDVKSVEDAENVAYASVIKSLQQISETYQVLSRNLNPDGVLYAFSGPAITHTEKTVSLKRLFLFGILLMLLALPVILFGCLLHARVQEEELLDEESGELVEGAA